LSRSESSDLRFKSSFSLLSAIVAARDKQDEATQKWYLVLSGLFGTMKMEDARCESRNSAEYRRPRTSIVSKSFDRLVGLVWIPCGNPKTDSEKSWCYFQGSSNVHAGLGLAIPCRFCFFGHMAITIVIKTS
jgi:hypothetical protein